MYKYLPFEYTFNTRIKTKTERLSWFVIFPAFLVFIGLLQIEAQHWFQVVVAFLVCMSSYEIGYIYNDNITVINESNPTNRIKSLPNNFSYKKAVLGCFFSFFILIMSSVILWEIIFTCYLMSVFLIIQIVFYAHNTIRSQLNVVTYFGLVSCRYLLPIGYFIGPTTAILVLLMFPICRTIEHACKIKYGFSFLYKTVTNFDLFRVFYYLLVFILVLFICSNSHYIYIALYFLVYRLLAYTVANKSFAKRHKHDSYK